MSVAIAVIIGGVAALLGVLLGVALGRYWWRVDDLAARAAKLESERDLARNEKNALALEAARLSERAQSRAELEQRLNTEFENIAHRVLRSNAAALTENSQKALNAAIEPLRERIQDFQKKVEDTYSAETREVLSLKEQIRLAVETSRDLGSKADGLTQALRGDSQLLGRWGEIVLERILEQAGLSEGREYVSQGRGLGLRSEQGGIQRPDIVVRLPESRTMIIDSKVPLAGYERLIAAREEADLTRCGDQFVRDVKGHIDGLSGKRYQENQRLAAHDCVLMFVPIEGALAAALTADPALFAYGWERRVVLVGPSTLLMTMQTVASIWRYELQGQHAQEIARLAGELCDKLSLSLDDLNTVAEKINGALGAHYDAVKRLASGKGNALSIGARIRELGVKTRRPTPAALVGGAEVAASAEDYIPIVGTADAAE